MEYKDYYKMLGVARDASADDIKRAYRKAARRYHPDVSKEADAEDRFKDVSEAYEVLRDPEKREAYDAIPPGGPAAGARASAGNGQPGFDFHGGSYTGADDVDFSEFFESMFGHRGAGFSGARAGQANAGTRAGAARFRGQDLHTRVELAIEDAFVGGHRAVTLRSPEPNADGSITERDRSLRIRIPKGVRAGQQLRLAGQGGPGFGPDAPAGDLFLEIGFAPHPIYRLDERDLIVDLPVAPWEAALGATIKTPTPAGAVDLKIPPGSNTARRLRLKGRGMPGDTTGDLYVVLRITLPPTGKEPDDDTRVFYEQMAERMAFNPRAGLGV